MTYIVMKREPVSVVIYTEEEQENVETQKLISEIKVSTTRFPSLFWDFLEVPKTTQPFEKLIYQAHQQFVSFAYCPMDVI